VNLSLEVVKLGGQALQGVLEGDLSERKFVQSRPLSSIGRSGVD
jgi:hypothetical protein